MATIYIPIDKINYNLSLKSETSFSDILSILYRIYYYNKINFKNSVNDTIIKYEDLMKDKFKNCMNGENCTYNRNNLCYFLHPRKYELTDKHNFDTSFNILSRKKEFINYIDNNCYVEIFKKNDYFEISDEEFYDDKVDLHNKIFCIDEYLNYKNFKYCEKQLCFKNGLIVIITFKKKHREYIDSIHETIDYFYDRIISPIYDQINIIDENRTFTNYFLEYNKLESEKEKKINELIINHSNQKKIERSYKNKILMLFNWIRIYQIDKAINIDHLDEDEFYKKFKFVRPNIEYVSFNGLAKALADKHIPAVTWLDVPDKYKNHMECKRFQQSLMKC
jgi:hypothetical protein